MPASGAFEFVLEVAKEVSLCVGVNLDPNAATTSLEPSELPILASVCSKMNTPKRCLYVLVSNVSQNCSLNTFPGITFSL